MELDLQGNLAGRWDIDGQEDSPLAFTSNGGLYAALSSSPWDRKQVTVFDRATSTFRKTNLSVPGHIIATDGNNFVVEQPDRYQHRLLWVRADSAHPETKPERRPPA